MTVITHFIRNLSQFKILKYFQYVYNFVYIIYLRVLEFMLLDDEERLDPMITVFPKVKFFNKRVADLVRSEVQIQPLRKSGSEPKGKTGFAKKFCLNFFLPPTLDFCDPSLNFSMHPCMYSYFINDQPPSLPI